MPSARALLVASLLTEPPVGCLGPSGNDRYRKRSLRSQTVGGFASQLPSRGDSFAMIGHQPTCSGRRYWRIHRNDPNCILSQIAASTESLLAWKLRPRNQRQPTDLWQDKNRAPARSTSHWHGWTPCGGVGRRTCRAKTKDKQIQHSFRHLSANRLAEVRQMSQRDDDLRIRPGRIGNRGGGKQKTFVHQVLRAAKRAGGEAGGRGRGRSGRSGFGRGRSSFSRSRLLGSQRRVLVKARVVRGRSLGARRAPLAAHLSYLKRDGVTRDGTSGQMFDAARDQADDRAFVERCRDDRHHFRFIVSPEDAGEMTDLRAFTRDLAARMEIDLGTRLDWIGIDHWNTDNPHVHLLVRGVA